MDVGCYGGYCHPRSPIISLRTTNSGHDGKPVASRDQNWRPVGGPARVAKPGGRVAAVSKLQGLWPPNSWEVGPLVSGRRARRGWTLRKDLPPTYKSRMCGLTHRGRRTDASGSQSASGARRCDTIRICNGPRARPWPASVMDRSVQSVRGTANPVLPKRGW